MTLASAMSSLNGWIKIFSGDGIEESSTPFSQFSKNFPSLEYNKKQLLRKTKVLIDFIFAEKIHLLFFAKLIVYSAFKLLIMLIL